MCVCVRACVRACVRVCVCCKSLYYICLSEQVYMFVYIYLYATGLPSEIAVGLGRNAVCITEDKNLCATIIAKLAKTLG